MIIRHSRNNYRVPADESVASLVSKFIRDTKSDNVRIENLGGQHFLLFPAKIYRDEKHVEKFVNAVIGKKLQKESDGIAKKAENVTDADLALINKFTLKPLKKEEVSVYTMKAANNKVDRDMERFHEEVLDSFAKTIVGKSWLYMHNKREYMPFGKIFEAWTVVENGVKWLYVKGYVLNTDAELVEKIDSGIWKFVSIGFIAPGFMAVLDAAGKVMHFEYRNVQGKEAEGLELSLVWLGAQYEAEVTKDPDEALAVMKQARQLLSVDQLEQCKTLDEVKSTIEQVKAGSGQSHPQIKGVRSMKHLMKFFGRDKLVTVADDVNDDQLITAIQKAYDETATEVLVPLQEENKTLKATIEQGKSAIAGFKDALVNEVATLINSVTKFVDDSERATEVTRLKALDVPALQAEKEIWKAKAEKRAPAADAPSQTEIGDKEKAPQSANVNAVQTFID